jgi:protein involved in polysaccharide export with SLBB domain
LEVSALSAGLVYMGGLLAFAQQANRPTDWSWVPKMKSIFLPSLFLIAVLCGAASGQNQTRSRRVTGTDSNASLTTKEVGRDKESNHSERNIPASAPDQKSPQNNSSQRTSADNGSSNQRWGNAAVFPAPSLTKVQAPADRSPLRAVIPTRNDAEQLIDRTVMTAGPISLITTKSTKVTDTVVGDPMSISRTPLPLMEQYRVGVGDVLDIRIVDMPTRESTLFTVLAGGTVEYPLLNEPINVSGMTTDEITGRLADAIKVINNARVAVTVRDYYSHGVTITGLVDNPGRKALRREAMPLYVLLAEALPRAEASVATIVRNGKPEPSFSLNDQKAMATLVVSGDLIRISGSEATAKQFIYAGGEVSSPGEKDFRSGMTLTQALLTCGGRTRSAGKIVKISRRNAEGFLSTVEYDLRAIEEGRLPDPIVQVGDRIEVARGVW